MDIENSTQSGVESFKSSLVHFGFADYLVFVAMLIGCTFVGLYFGYEDYKKRKTVRNHRRGSEAQEYLMGGKNMNIFPVAMSLVASCISGIALLGTSTEIYLYGYQYAYILVGYVIATIIIHYTVIPIYHELQITSAYEYLQLRFDKRVRLFGSAMFTLSTLLWMPIAIYVPALAFAQVTGLNNIHTITPIVMSICIFYTCLGGIKAVVWTDVIQIMLMYGTLVLIIVKGTYDVGGLSVVLERNLQSGRLSAPDFRIDPTIRITFWTMALGGAVFRTYVGINQSMIQRYMTMKDVHNARKCQVVYLIGIVCLNLMCYYNGLLLYARYYQCDPLTTKLAQAKDQMMPLLVMEILKDIPGMSGLFIAGVFSAALSSLSTALNSMSAVVLEDFCKTFIKSDITEKACAIILRGTVLFIGVISVAMVYVVKHMGSVLQLSMTVPSICFGPMLGVFIIGLVIPHIGTRATLFSALLSCLLMMAYIAKVQMELALGNIKYPMKPTSVDGCLYEFTAINNTNSFYNTENEDERGFFHISFMYNTSMGVILVLSFAFISSFYFGFRESHEIEVRLLAPFMRKYFTNGAQQEVAVKNLCEDTHVHEFELKENKL